MAAHRDAREVVQLIDREEQQAVPEATGRGAILSGALSGRRGRGRAERVGGLPTRSETGQVKVSKVEVKVKAKVKAEVQVKAWAYCATSK